MGDTHKPPKATHPRRGVARERVSCLASCITSPWKTKKLRASPKGSRAVRSPSENGEAVRGRLGEEFTSQTNFKI